MITLKKKAKPLSDVPSELLRQALADFLKMQSKPNVSVEMSDWVIFSHNMNACSVCHAGAVMASRFSVEDFGDDVEPQDFSGKDKAKFLFINSVRIGALRQAFNHLREEKLLAELPDFVVSDDPETDDSNMVPIEVANYYHSSRLDYIHYIQGMIGILEAEGL